MLLTGLETHCDEVASAIREFLVSPSEVQKRTAQARKVAGIQEAHIGVRHVAFERLSTSWQEEGIVLPHTARNGGMCLRK